VGAPPGELIGEFPPLAPTSAEGVRTDEALGLGQACHFSSAKFLTITFSFSIRPWPSLHNAPISIDFPSIESRIIDHVASVVRVADFARAGQGLATTTLRVVIVDIHWTVCIDGVRSIGPAVGGRIRIPEGVKRRSEKERHGARRADDYVTRLQTSRAHGVGSIGASSSPALVKE
jgi:hypothetical protein